MEDLGYPALIEEWKQNIHADAYENNLYQDVKISSIKKNIDRNHKTEYWPTNIKEILNWLPFSIMEFNTDRIENDKNLYRHC